MSPLPSSKTPKSEQELSDVTATNRNYPIPDIVVKKPKEEEKNSNKFRRPSLKLLPPSSQIDQQSDADNMSTVSESSYTRDGDGRSGANSPY